MNSIERTADRAPSRLYSNVVLTVIAGLLALNLTDRLGETSLTTAHAQNAAAPEDEGSAGLISGGEQMIIRELRNIVGRLDKAEAASGRVMNVKVVEMPPVRIQEKSEKP